MHHVTKFLQRIMLALLPIGVATTTAQADDTCNHALNLNGHKIPYCRTHPLNTENKGITRAVIVVHGASNNAVDYFGWAKRAAEAVGSMQQVSILAPQFLDNQDQAENNDSNNTYEYWTGDTWRLGFKSSSGSQLTSYEWLDQLVDRLLDKHPNLVHIAVVGFSGGGQMVQRYAGVAESYDTAIAASVTMSFVVMSPGSYMWLNDSRIGSYDNCAKTYDAGGYGVPGMAGFAYAKSRGISADQIRLNHATRPIYHAVGLDDNLRDAPFDTSCEADSQGDTRLERAIQYSKNRRPACSDALSLAQRPPEGCDKFSERDYRVEIVPGVGHKARDMFYSNVGRDLLFFR